MYNPTDFLSALRHFLPSAERFLFETLSVESLSTEARETLSGIQNTLTAVVSESDSYQATQAKVAFYYKSSFRNSPGVQCSSLDTLGDLCPPPDPPYPLDTSISPPTQFRDEVQLSDEIDSDSQYPQSKPSSQNSDFKLNFDSTNDNSPVSSEIILETTTTTTTTQSANIDSPVPSDFSDVTLLSSINSSKKRPTTDEFVSKKVKLTSPESPVLISDCDTEGHSDVISPDSLAGYDAACFEDFGDFPGECLSPKLNGACSKSAASSSSSSSYTSCSMSSSLSTPERLFVYLFTCLLVYLYTCLPVYLFTCLLVYLFTCLHAYMFTCILVYLFTCLHVYLYTCLLVYLFTCLLVYLFVYFIEICQMKKVTL